MIERITDGTLSELRKKIDSEQFSEKFVNVLQSKLLADTNKSNSNDETEPFLNKFISLFDKIIKTAIYNNNQSLTMPPTDIADGIEKYLIKVKGTDANAGITDTLIARYKTAADAVLAAWVPPGPDYKGNPTLDFIDKLREAVKRSASMGDVMFNFALHETIENYKNEKSNGSSATPSAPPVLTTATTVNNDVIKMASTNFDANTTPVVAESVDGSNKSKTRSLMSGLKGLANLTGMRTPKSTSQVTPIANAVVAPDKGGRGKRTRKVSRKSMSRKNRRNRATALTKRNLFL
jgi:hypothetical protein